MNALVFDFEKKPFIYFLVVVMTNAQPSKKANQDDWAMLPKHCKAMVRDPSFWRKRRELLPTCAQGLRVRSLLVPPRSEEEESFCSLLSIASCVLWSS